MRILKAILFMFMLVISINYVYSDEPVCCYELDSGNINPKVSCGDEGINVGPIDGRNFCDGYEEQRLGCMRNGECKATVNGKNIYDFPVILDSFDGGISMYCDSTVPYNSVTCAGSAEGIDDGSDGGSPVDPGDDGSVPGDGSGDRIDFENILRDTSVLDKELEYCNNKIKPFGFFISENICESDSSGEASDCLFNPFLGGKFSSDYSELEAAQLSKYEKSCVSLSSISQCHDYKTEENCNENLASSYNPRLDLGCTWVPAVTYSSGFFDTKDGVCISSSVKDDSDLDSYNYAFRYNLIKNPSFEDGISGWNSGSVSNVKFDRSTFNGLNYYMIPSGGEISQEIMSVGGGIAYSLDFYGRVMDDTESGTVTVRLIAKNKDGVEVGAQGFSKTFEDIYEGKKRGHFKRVVFDNQFTTPTDAYSIDVRISTTASIDVDAISFEPFDAGSAATSNLIFKPFELSSSSASNCEYCFENLKLNLCTERKSEIMGDCSYMVENMGQSYNADHISNYTGKDLNIHINTTDTQWSSQALADSLVFCEMYLYQSICESPDNLVNSKFAILHSNSGSKLCKWNENIGCFKDSNNDDFPDTMNATPLDFSTESWSVGNYVTLPDETNPISDYALACDSIPPNSYVFFWAKDDEGNVISVTGDSSEVIGDVDISISTSDIIGLESCELNNLNIDSKIYFAYEVNGEFFIRTTESNQLVEKMPIKEYFVNEDGDQYIVDGDNSIRLMVYDQSGNIGKSRDFDLKLDLTSPNISLVSPEEIPSGSSGEVITTVVGPDTNLEFDIRDTSRITYCNYSLNPWSSDVPNTFYNDSGEISAEDLDLINGGNPSYSLDLPIFNTSSTGDGYILDLACEDVFEQKTVFSISFWTDFNTDMVLITPMKYFDFDWSSGFLNGPTEIHAISSDDSLSNCYMNFGDGNIDLTVIDATEPFTHPSYGDTEFHTNLTGTLNFGNNQGLNNGVIRCTDSSGNIIQEDLSYYWDTLDPTYNGEFNIIDSSSVKKSYLYDGKYYVRNRNPGILNVTLDGTVSWIADSFSINVYRESGLDDSWEYTGGRYDFDITESNTISNVKIRNYAPPEAIYVGLPSDEKNILTYSYRLNFEDKAGNVNGADIEYYLDNSTPRFNFSGDVFSRVGNKIYTSAEDPNIVLGFNTPEYRSYRCNVTGDNGKNSFILPRTLEGNTVNFRFSEINSLMNFNVANPLELTIACKDVYGLILKNTFDVYFDNTPPELVDVYLENGNDKYNPNLGSTGVYPSINDNIVFEFTNTGEFSYKCYYKVDSNRYYDCREDYNEVIFTSGNVLQKANNVNFISSTGDLSGLCVRNSALLNDLSSSSGKVSTNLNIDAYCTDMVDLESESKDISMSIDYVDTEIVAFEYDYGPGMAYPIVSTINPFDEIIISMDSGGSGSGDLITLTSYETTPSGFFRYKGSSGIDISSFSEGSHITYAHAYSSGTKYDSMDESIVVDKDKPGVEMKVWDNNDGVIYGDEFDIQFEAWDNENQLRVVYFYINNNLVYNSSNSESFGYNSDFIMKPLNSDNYYSYDKKSYSGDIDFINGEFGQSYNLKVVAYDKSGNMNQSSLDVVLSDALSITLIDSSNAFADFDRRSWVTDVSAPIISFKTSKVVSNCMLYPANDSEWVDLTGNPFIMGENFEASSTDTFSFDLSEKSFYDLSLLSDMESNALIVCLYNSSYYKFTRAVRMINYLPDYVLESSEGFVFNEEPYKTNIEVRSVGPYRYVTCKYGFGTPTQNVPGGTDTVFNFQLDLESKSSGTHELKLECEDRFGNKGPTKEYDFVVNKNMILSMSDVKLSIDGLSYDLVEGSTNSISNEDLTYDLSFKLNKKDVTCSYVINPTGSMVDGVVNFFKDMFSAGYQEITNVNDPYTFQTTGVTFDSDLNVFKISCDDGTNTVSKNYNIEKVDSSLTITVS